MTTFQRASDRYRDMQDGTERHVFKGLEHLDGAGSIVRVTGTGTEDEEAPVLNSGYGMNFPSDYNTEVILFSLGSDTNLKYALMNIPRDKQRPWAENTGGVQSPIDPNNALQFEDGLAWFTASRLLFGPNKEVELNLSGGQLEIKFNGKVKVTSTELFHNDKSVGDTHTHGGVEIGGESTEVPD